MLQKTEAGCNSRTALLLCWAGNVRAFCRGRVAQNKLANTPNRFVARYCFGRPLTLSGALYLQPMKSQPTKPTIDQRVFSASRNTPSSSPP